MIHLLQWALGKDNHGGDKGLLSMAINKANTSKNSLEGVSVQHDRQKWRGWIKSIGIQEVDIIPFYFGSTTTKTWQNLTGGERAFIIRELFIDAVSIGAIILPVQVGVKDFSFELYRPSPLSRDLLSIEYSRLGVRRGNGFWDGKMVA